MPQFIFRGQFSKGLDTQTSMGVTFVGREPSGVTDGPAINWLRGHPDYEEVPEPASAKPERQIKPERKAPAKRKRAKKK